MNFAGNSMPTQLFAKDHLIDPEDVVGKRTEGTVSFPPVTSFYIHLNLIQSKSQSRIFTYKRGAAPRLPSGYIPERVTARYCIGSGCLIFLAKTLS